MPSSPASTRVRHARAAALLAALAAASAPFAGCSLPSESVDGRNLEGVFDRDAGAVVSPDASARPRDGGRDAAPDGAVTVQPPPRVRAPSEGACVAPGGAPAGELRRTLGRPACRDAQVLEWRDPGGSPRYACVITPRGIETRAPVPLVVFFHAPSDDPTSVDKQTGLRKLAGRFELSPASSHTGFVVLAPQGRAIRGGVGGSRFDADYAGPDNVDVLAVDHFVEAVVAKGIVDVRRIYALGASEGGRMAASWAMMRADRVAAFATFASDGPTLAWVCAEPPPPALVIYRACDDDVPCESVERWLRARDAAAAETSWLRLGAVDDEEPACAVRNKCSKQKGSANHRRWPRGREDDILRFFAGHALAAAERTDGGLSPVPILR